MSLVLFIHLIALALEHSPLLCTPPNLELTTCNVTLCFFSSHTGQQLEPRHLGPTECILPLAAQTPSGVQNPPVHGVHPHPSPPQLANHDCCTWRALPLLQIVKPTTGKLTATPTSRHLQDISRVHNSIITSSKHLKRSTVGHGRRVQDHRLGAAARQRTSSNHYLK